MRRFLVGLLLGLAVMYGYIYYKDAIVLQVKEWLAEASHDPDGAESLEKLLSGNR